MGAGQSAAMASRLPPLPPGFDTASDDGTPFCLQQPIIVPSPVTPGEPLLPPRKMSSPLISSQRALFLCLDPPTPARVYGCLNLPASASARALGGRPCKRCRCLVLPPQLLGGTLLPCNVAGVLAAGQVGRRRATGAHRQGNNGRTQAGVGEGTQLPCKFAWPAAVSRLPRALLACGHYNACY